MNPDDTYLFRFTYTRHGGHTHVAVRAGRGTLSLALCGNVVFRNEEWDAFMGEVQRGKAGGDIEFVEQPA